MHSKTKKTLAQRRASGVGSGRLVRRFVVGDRVEYVNHVTGHDLGVLEVVTVDKNGGVTAKRLFGGEPYFRFHSNGRAKWSSNLSILPPNKMIKPRRISRHFHMRLHSKKNREPNRDA